MLYYYYYWYSIIKTVIHFVKKLLQHYEHLYCHLNQFNASLLNKSINFNFF